MPVRHYFVFFKHAKREKKKNPVFSLANKLSLASLTFKPTPPVPERKVISTLQIPLAEIHPEMAAWRPPPSASPGPTLGWSAAPRWIRGATPQGQS